MKPEEEITELIQKVGGGGKDEIRPDGKQETGNRKRKSEVGLQIIINPMIIQSITNRLIN